MASNVQEELVTSNSMTISAFGAPGGGVGGSFETVDFSLPSYDQAVGKATKAMEQIEAPKFSNPFGSSDSEDKVADEAKDEKKDEGTAEREAAKSEREAAKAEAEAKKAEEKAAAEQAKAAKEARKKEQLEKQRAAVERQKEYNKSEVKEEVRSLL